ncbi:MAG: hypothetical protein M1318_01215 [Firmicutes bacterium]|nr:hypothetical protein [Bacillota bacterium]
MQDSTISHHLATVQNTGLVKQWIYYACQDSAFGQVKEELARNTISYAATYYRNRSSLFHIVARTCVGSPRQTSHFGRVY